MKAERGDVVIIAFRSDYTILPVIGKVQMVYPDRNGNTLYEVQYWNSTISLEVPEADVLKVLVKAG